MITSVSYSYVFLATESHYSVLPLQHQSFTSDLTIDLLDSPLLEEDDYDHVDSYFVTVKERAVDTAESVGEFIK